MIYGIKEFICKLFCLFQILSLALARDSVVDAMNGFTESSKHLRRL